MQNICALASFLTQNENQDPLPSVQTHRAACMFCGQIHKTTVKIQERYKDLTR